MLELIIYGLIHEGDWDLTQPQAVIIAGAVSGTLLVAGAYIAFHGQREQRNEEKIRHKELLAQQSRHFRNQIAAQREEYREGHKASSDLKYRDEVRELYVRTLKSISAMQDSMIRQHSALLTGAESEMVAQQAKALTLLHERIALRGELRLVQTPEIGVTFVALNKAEQSEAEQHANRVRRVKDGASVNSLGPRGGDEIRRLEMKLATLMRTHLEELQPKGETRKLPREGNGDKPVTASTAPGEVVPSVTAGNLTASEGSTASTDVPGMSESRRIVDSSDTWEI